MQWKAEEKSEDTAQKGRNKINLKAAWGPKKFGGPGELSPASPPLCLPAGSLNLSCHDEIHG